MLAVSEMKQRMHTNVHPFDFSQAMSLRRFEGTGDVVGRILEITLPFGWGQAAVGNTTGAIFPGLQTDVP